MPYDLDFLGNNVSAPLPTFSASLDGHILRSDALREQIYADYPNFSVVMNHQRRSAAFVALNIDQSRLGGHGSKSWDYAHALTATCSSTMSTTAITCGIEAIWLDALQPPGGPIKRKRTATPGKLIIGPTPRCNTSGLTRTNG